MRKAARSKPKAGADGPVAVALAIQATLDRESLTALLRSHPGLRLVGAARSGEETTRLCARKRPAVAIIDTTLLWPLGSCRIADVLETSPQTRVLALPPHDAPWCAVLNPSSHIEDWDGDAGNGLLGCLRLAVREGAHGVLRRSCSARELIQAIRALARGRFWVGSEVALRDPCEPSLSERERAVARMVGQGLSNKEIARTLLISGLTVKKHVSHILGKLKLHDRLQLGLCVARHPSVFAEKTERSGRAGA